MFIIIFVLLQLITSKLSVISPPELKKQLEKSIKFNLANFGTIPWNTQKVGLLDVAVPFDGCSEIISDIIGQFILIERGNCSFVTKVRNAQKAGYELAIIADTYFDNINNAFIMADDGYGHQITIPSILIGEKPAKKIKQFFQSTQEVLDIVLLINFEFKKQEKLQLLFAIDLSHLQSLKVVRDFENFYQTLNTTEVQYEFLYPIYTSKNKDNPSCMKGGRYCSNSFGSDDYSTGEDTLEEIIRQQCLFSLNQKQFFIYMSQFSMACLDSKDLEQCSFKIMDKLDISKDNITNCFKGSFVNFRMFVGEGDDNTYNSILENQLRLTQEIHIKAFPSVVVNHYFFQENLTGVAIFNNICQSLLNPPETCLNRHQRENSQDLRKIQISFIITLVILFALFLLVIFLLRRSLKKSEQLYPKEQVSELITQYMKFVQIKQTEKTQQSINLD